MRKRQFLFIWIAIAVLVAAFALHAPVLAEEKTAQEKEEQAGEEAASKVGQGVIWLPRLSFPPSDPSKEAGYLPLFDRDISFEYLGLTFYLSWKRSLEITRKNSDFYLRLHGRLYLDFTDYFDDKNDLGSNGFGIRTFLIEADGRFNEQWLYRLSVGGLTSGGRFDGSEAFLDDAYVTYLGTKRAWLFGQFAEPFSLEQITSSLATTFMERALPNALVPGNNVGVGFCTNQKRWSLSAGIFGEDLASSKDTFDQGFGLTGRFVFRPERPDGKLYHLGVSFSHRLIRGGDPLLYRRRPESGLTNVRYVNTGEIFEGESVTRAGFEGAVAMGPLSLQAEYIKLFVSRESGYEDLDFDGWYAYVSWFPTGESRKYFPLEGIFGYPEVKSKWGAVELAARYSTLDLTDGAVLGGQERNITFGVNWYLSPRYRLMANYIWVFCDENANDDGTLLGDDSPRILQFRFQWRF